MNIPICPCVKPNSFCSCDPSAENWVWNFGSLVAKDPKAWLEGDYTSQVSQKILEYSHGMLTPEFTTTQVVPITVWTCGETPYNDYGSIIEEAKEWLKANANIDVETDYDFSNVFLPPHQGVGEDHHGKLSDCPGGTTGAAGASARGFGHHSWVYMVQEKRQQYERMGSTGGVFLHEWGHSLGAQHGTLGGGEPGDFASLMDTGDALYQGFHAFFCIISDPCAITFDTIHIFFIFGCDILH